MTKLHNRREPPGLERAILRKLPMALAGSTLVPIFLSLGVRIVTPDGSIADVAKQTTSVDIFAIALGVTAWTAVLTVAIGCVVVIVMKGPAYIADAYPLDDAARPRGRAVDD